MLWPPQGFYFNKPVDSDADMEGVKFRSYNPHFYAVDAWMPRNHVFVKKDIWSALDEATQNVIRGCAGLAAYAGHGRAVQYTDFTLKGLAENGMTVAAPSEQLKSELHEVGETLVEDWKETAGEEGQAIIDAYRGN
ncbi:MAG TPA: hypothetical protein VFJ13_02330 [Paracoccaceae bacterium]|nr:hypothetical protein [Paracoccaceae bacterium]